MNTLGQHLLLECEGVDAQRLADPVALEAVLYAAAAAAGAQALFGHCHHFGEQQGVTGVLLLRESHLSIHTWPEYGYAAIDVFMCGNARPELAADLLVSHLQPQQQRRRVLARGLSAALPLTG